MTDGPVNVDGLRGLLNVSPEEMPDSEIRRALAILASNYSRAESPETVAKSARRFADFLNRSSLGPV